MRGDGGTGTDTFHLDVSNQANSLTSGVGNDTGTGSFGANTAFYKLSTGETVWHRNFEKLQVTAGSGADNFGGSALNDILNGAGGADILNGLAGNDAITGGDAVDTLNGGVGDDFVSGGAGDDILRGDVGYDALDGGDGNDTLDGGATPTSILESLFGGAGNDILKGSHASMTGGSGDDRILFAPGYGSSRVDDFVTGSTEDKVDLTAFTNLHSLADVLALVTASSAAGVTIEFNANDSLDLAFANGGSLTEADFIFVPSALDFNGGPTNNTWSLTHANLASLPDKRGDGGAGIDTLSINLTGFTGVLTSGVGNDAGGLGANTAFYHLSNNVDVWHRNFETFNIVGGSGNDNFGGGALNDTLNGGIGTDTMRGLAGNDTYVVDRTTDVVTEAVSAGTDLVQSSATYTLSHQRREPDADRHRGHQRHRQYARQHHHRQRQCEYPRRRHGH